MSSAVAGERMPRSLWPKEHGAYAQLLVPLLVAFLVVSPTLAGVGWAAASVFAFLAHEPALVLLGQRGPRARREAGAGARRRLILLGGAAALASGAALAVGPDVTAALAGVGLAAGLAAGLVLSGRGRSALGELAAAVALSGAGSLVSTAGGEPVTQAGLRWAAWALAFGAATGAVRGLIASSRGRSEPWGWPLLFGAGLLCILGGAQSRLLFSAAPLCVASLVVRLARPAPRRLRMIGVVLVVVALGCGAIQIVLVR